MKTWKIAGINFDHFHMGDLLRMAYEHPNAEIVGICDEQPARMQEAARNFHLDRQKIFTDYERCLEETKPDLVILCPATAQHAEWTMKVAPFNVHILVEKPFAASINDADRMIAAMVHSGKTLVINWPLRWVPAHVTTHRLIQEGAIGDVIEVHFYDGNRGPLYHGADKVAISEEVVEREKPHSWWYKKEFGGGSLRDYLGYGTTLGTWFLDGRAPLEVTCIVDHPDGLEVDEHSVTVARYAFGLSKFETRWGTFTDPWTHQPQPRCGFVVVGRKGTISSYDYAPTIQVQTHDYPAGRDVPADMLEFPNTNPIAYLLHCLEAGTEVDGPLSVRIARTGQQIVDAAIRSAELKRTVWLSDNR